MEQIVDGATAILQQYSALVVALLAAGGGTMLIWRKLIRPIMSAVAEIRELVAAQLNTNGGGSLVDKVDKLHTWRAEVDADLDEMRSVAERVEKNQHVLERSIEKLSDELDDGLREVNLELDRRKTLITRVIDQMPEPQRTVVEAFIAEAKK